LNNSSGGKTTNTEINDFHEKTIHTAAPRKSSNIGGSAQSNNDEIIKRINVAAVTTSNIERTSSNQTKSSQTNRNPNRRTVINES